MQKIILQAQRRGLDVDLKEPYIMKQRAISSFCRSRFNQLVVAACMLDQDSKSS
jgi:hypothetical protein